MLSREGWTRPPTPERYTASYGRPPEKPIDTLPPKQVFKTEGPRRGGCRRCHSVASLGRAWSLQEDSSVHHVGHPREGGQP